MNLKEIAEETFMIIKRGTTYFQEKFQMHPRRFRKNGLVLARE